MATHNNDDDGLPNLDLGGAQSLPDAEPEDMALLDVLADVGGASTSAVVRIYRQGPNGYRDLTYLTECRPEEFTMQRLQSDYRGGTFRVHVRDKGRLLANQEIKVEPPAPPVGASSDMAALDPVMRQMQAMQDAMTKLLERIAAPPAAPAAPSRQDIIQEMLQMKELFAAPTRSEDPVAQLLKFAELRKALTDVFPTGDAADAAKPGMLETALEKFGPALLQAFAVQQSRQPIVPATAMPAPPGQATMAATPQPAAAPIHQPPAADTAAAPQPTDEGTAMLKHYLQFLAVKADGDSDPDTYAGLIYDNLTPEQMHTILDPANWFENLCALVPEISPFKEWFSEVREGVFERLKEEESAGTSGANPTGTTSDHAFAGSPGSNTPGAS